MTKKDITHKICSTCGIDKPRTEFYMQRDYLSGQCKTCFSEYKKSRYKNGTTRAYHLTDSQNRRAAKLGLGRVEKEDIESILSQPSCHYCKYPNDGSLVMHIEHRQPLSRGGSHSVDNLVLTCQCCNMGKQNLTEEEFRGWLSGIASRLSA